MGRFLLGAFSVILLVAVVSLAAWGLGQLGLVDLKPIVLQAAGVVTGIKDLQENYELGNKRGAILGEKEAELRSLELKVTAREAKLSEEISNFDAAKLQWEKEKLNSPVPTKPGQGGKQNSKNLPNPEEAKFKDYLAQVGNMKPAKAAEVIQKLPEGTVFLLFDQLPASKVSKIMENLPSDYLARLTQSRARLSRNP